MVEYFLAITNEEYASAKSLFNEYVIWLNIDLSFQRFDEELQNLKLMYSINNGGIILCKSKNKFIACVAIRKINNEIAELKRMYVQPLNQHQGIGQSLLLQAIELAKKHQYKFIRLDTLSNMYSAINLYKRVGFYIIEPYYHNPNITAVFMEYKII